MDRYAGSSEALLVTLARHRVKATFFLVGESIEAHPDQARAIAAAGHQIGNHSYTHSRMVFRSPSFIRSEVERTDAAIASTGYRGDGVFRPPFGKKLVYLPYYLGRRGIPTIMWDVEPDSDLDASADDIVRRAVDQVRPGSIILLHVMMASTGPVAASRRADGRRAGPARLPLRHHLGAARAAIVDVSACCASRRR